MTRIMLFVGKGGVGKTTVSASTGYMCAQQGLKTLVMSLDAAHSLSDAFDLPVDLLNRHKGQATEIEKNLWVQEIDVQEALQENWGEVFSYISTLFQTTGFDEIIAEELAILPGMEEVVGLLYINSYHNKKQFDVIILDCAPTGESLRFLSMPSSLEWYMKKIFKLERNVARIARPIMKTLTDIPMPEDELFVSIENLFGRLKGVNELLLDPQSTTVRLVTNAEKMVVKETQRAFMYFCMFGMAIDMVVVNRLLPDEITDPYFQQWKELQQNHTAEISNYFDPVPTRKIPLFNHEMVGGVNLQHLAHKLYGEDDPAQVFHAAQPYKFAKNESGGVISLQLPFTSQKDVQLFKEDDQLIVRIGNFKRHIPLPRSFKDLSPSGATFEGERLDVSFS